MNKKHLPYIQVYVEFDVGVYVGVILKLYWSYIEAYMLSKYNIKYLKILIKKWLYEPKKKFPAILL